LRSTSLEPASPPEKGETTVKQRKASTEAVRRATDLQIQNPDAAGIDLGSREHFVAVPEDRDTQPVKSFGCYTEDLHRLARWLKDCAITTVAMESTGVYWVPVYEILEQYGFEVHLVDARQLKNVSGRKSDVQDCQWIQRLHSYGLLSSAFRPLPEIATLRSYWRQRKGLTDECGRLIQLMHKALEQMNVQLHKAVADVTGKTGLEIIRAIVAGERQPEQLVRFRHAACKVGPQEFVAALNGNFKDEHVFALRQSLAAYDFYQGLLQECDQQMQTYMAQLPSRTEPDTAAPHKRRKNQPYFDLRREQVRISGIDLTVAPGIDVLTAQSVFSEVGLDVERFPSDKNFTSWLCLCPNNRKTGGRIRSSRTRPNAHRLATALRLAAQSVGRSKTALGAFYRRLAARIGAAKAITATARKLACIIYRMLKYGQAYVEQGQLAYEQAYKQRSINNIRRQAHNLGFHLVAATTGEVS